MGSVDDRSAVSVAWRSSRAVGVALAIVLAQSAVAQSQSVPSPSPQAGQADSAPSSASAEQTLGAASQGDPRTRARHSEPTTSPPAPETTPRDSWFPQELRPLSSYLQMANRFGTNALKPGALIASDPISDTAQAAKTELAKIGLRYSFEQDIMMAAESNRVQGDSVIGAYAHDFFANWTIFEADEFGGTCGWITGKTVGAVGLGVDLDQQNIRSNIGAIVSRCDGVQRRSSAPGFRSFERQVVICTPDLRTCAPELVKSAVHLASCANHSSSCSAEFASSTPQLATSALRL